MGISAQMVSVSRGAVILLFDMSSADGADTGEGRIMDVRRPALTWQMFLSQTNKVYVLDKTENNPINVTGKYGTHPAWAVEYDTDGNTCECLFVPSSLLTVADRPMDVYSNTFCAGGAVMGNGTWVVFGGNQRTSIFPPFATPPSMISMILTSE
jgi:hypothetical protein